MKLAAQNRNTKAILVILCVASFSGCAFHRFLPSNHMCPNPHTGMYAGSVQCQNECCRSQPTMAAVEEVGPIPTAAGTVQVLPLVQDQLRELTEKNNTIQDQMMMLDKSLEAQRLDREQVLRLMQDLVSELSAVRNELDSHRVEVAEVETRMDRHRDQNERILSSVERQLNDLLTPYEN